MQSARFLTSRAGVVPPHVRHSTPKGWRWDSAAASLRPPLAKPAGWGTMRLPWRLHAGRKWNISAFLKDAPTPKVYDPPSTSSERNPLSRAPWRTRALTPSRCASSPLLRHRLRAKLVSWASLGASLKVQRWIREGVTPEFKRVPKPFHLGVSCESATPAQREFLLQEKERLFSVGAWERATCRKYVSRDFFDSQARWGLEAGGRSQMVEPAL